MMGWRQVTQLQPKQAIWINLANTTAIQLITSNPPVTRVWFTYNKSTENTDTSIYVIESPEDILLQR